MRRSLVALGLALVVSFTAQVELKPAIAANASLVVAALHTVELEYFRSVDSIALLNSAIAALRKATSLSEQGLPDIPAGTVEGEAIGKFNSAFSQAAKTGKMSETDLAYTVTSEMLASLHDSHVQYMPPAQFAEYQASLAAKPGFTGIGVNMIARENADGPFVFDVVPGSPAASAGIKQFDEITQVDGAPLNGLTLRAVSDKIRGPSGSTVTLTIRRGEQSLNIAVVRAPIQFRLVRAVMIRSGIAYVRIINFDQGTGDEFRRAIQSLGSPNDIHAVILDLRGNPGGLLREGASVAGAFLPSGTLLAHTLTRMGSTGPLAAMGVLLLPQVRLVVLADRGTASTSEAVAIGLRDAHRATIIGEKTAGAFGSTLSFPLPEGGMIVTTLELAGPQYEQVEGVGISPDTGVGLSADDMLHGNDPQLSAALSTLGVSFMLWQIVLAA